MAVFVIGALLLLGLVAVRAPAYEATVALGLALPSILGLAVEVVGEVGIVALAGAVALLAWRARRQGRRHVAVALSAGAASVVAYVASEVVKAVVREERPCRDLGVRTLAACPAAGDWSWPSNHSVIAAALATTVVLLAPLWWRAVVPCALAVGASRVITGAHYWHDVVAGLLTGALVVWVGTWYSVRHAYRLIGSHPTLARLAGTPEPSTSGPPSDRPSWVGERLNDVSRSASRATTTQGAGRSASSDDAWTT